MKPKYSIYYYMILIGLLLVSGIRLIDRFIIQIPDIAEIIISITGLLFFIVAICGNIRSRRKSEK